MTVTFFGHKNTPPEIIPRLEEVITDLIKNHGAKKFLVGSNGNFDFYVRKTLKKLKDRYAHITYAVVLAYLPTKKSEIDISAEYNTILFDGFEKAHPRYAIVKRNTWMIEKADVVVTYVNTTFGGAARFKELSEKKNKKVINL